MGFFDVIYEDPVPLGQPYPLFNRVSIETTAYCNRSCSFCPVSHGRRPRQISMDDALYTRIVDELGELEFNGCIQMFLLNEPTLDKKLKDRAFELRTACPKATIYMSTNADTLITPEDVHEYYDAGFNVINLNVYDTGPDQYSRLYKLYQDIDAEPTYNKYRRHSVRKRYVCLTDMRPERTDASTFDMFMNRSEEDRRVSKDSYCARPHRHIVARYDGKVPLCCAMDPTSDRVVIAGDLNEQSLLDVWNGEVMFKYRWRLQQAMRDLPGCDNCNHKMAYSHVIRRVDADEETLEQWRSECSRIA